MGSNHQLKKIKTNQKYNPFPRKLRGYTDVISI